MMDTRPTTLLCIVSRELPALYEHLKQEFSGEGEIQVIFDRRRGDRRSEKVAVSAERRRHDRRSQDLGANFQGLGWAFIPECRRTMA